MSDGMYPHFRLQTISNSDLCQIQTQLSVQVHYNYDMGGTDWGLLSSYAGLLTLATGSIYAGAFGSLPVCSSVFLKASLLILDTPRIQKSQIKMTKTKTTRNVCPQMMPCFFPL